MKYFITVLLVMIPFGTYVQAKILEPEQHSDIKFVIRDSTYDFIEHNGLVYTIADDGVHGLELWVFDEKHNSLRMVKDINPNGDANPMIFQSTLENVILFYAYDENGTGLWATDGTDKGTVLLKYFYFYRIIAKVMEDDWNSYIVYKDELYFSASESENQGDELWKTDGTSEGTVLVKDINPDGSSSPNNFHIRGDRLLFHTNRGLRDIWSTDGTEENTIKLTNSKDVLNSISILRWNSSYDFFLDSLGEKKELWSTDGTVGGAVPLTDKLDDYKASNSNYAFNGDNLFFEGYTNDRKLILLVSDGTLECTKKVKTFSSDPNAYFYFLSQNNDRQQKLFFFLFENQISSLWVTDGTEEGTKMISPLELEDMYENRESNYSDKLYFTNVDDENGEDLWVSDGTAEGTKFVKNLSVGNDRSRIEFSDKVVSDKVLFLYENEKGIKSIWITDGTEAGTYILNSELRNLYRMFYHENVINDILYFREMGNDNTFRLWRTDMTEDGTYKIMPKDQKNDVHVHEYFSFQIEYKNQVYFFADYYGEGQQLYRIPNTISSVEDTPQPELMTVYPNPAKDFIQLELSKPMQLSIVNSAGKKVKDFGVIADGKLNVAELISGVYFVVVEQGKNIAKFVKE